MVFRGDNIIITNKIAKSNLKGYSNKNNKISRDIIIMKGVPLEKTNKIGRNEPCHCGSGKKYKNVV